MRRLGTIVCSLCFLAGCSDGVLDVPSESPTPQATAPQKPNEERQIGVMTWNLYIGTDPTPILEATVPSQIPALVATLWGNVLATNFPERAVALADEITARQPHLVGLQEVALYRMQSPGDAAVGGSTPATDVALDFLQILLAALHGAGVEYDPVSIQEEFDFEVPMLVGTNPGGTPRFDDLRLTDRDVILARRDVHVVSASQANFASAIAVTVAGRTIVLPRGWTSAVATVAGTTFRFVNTHLEVQRFAPVQMAQTTELLGLLSNETLPVLLAGDLNSDGNRFQTGTYDLVTTSGYGDLWRLKHPGNPGLTCCQAPNLRNEHSQFDQRLDLILARGFGIGDQESAAGAGGTAGRGHEVGQGWKGVVHVKVVGDRRHDRTGSGLWPSDHAGVSAVLRAWHGRTASEWPAIVAQPGTHQSLTLTDDPAIRPGDVASDR